MKLLILGINFAPEMVAIGLYSTGLAEAMAEAGDQVEVVTAQPYYPAWKLMAGYPRFLWSQETLPSGVRIVHCPHYIPARPTALRRILHHATFALTALPVMLWKTASLRPDVVFVVEPALIPAPIGWLASKLCGAKSWLHVQDLEVEAAFATGLLAEQGRAGRLARAFNRWIHRRFDRVSSISPAMLDKLRDLGVPQDRLFELLNWAKLDVVTPLKRPSAYREEFGITTPHVALYSGNIANKQGLEILPEVARRLAQRTDLTFVICGDGPFVPELRRRAEGLANIRFFPLQPIERLGEMLGLASVHLLPQIAGVADLVLPSKLTNMLASGRPVVATAAPGTALHHAIEGCGLAVMPGDDAAMAQALTAVLDDPLAYEARCRLARDRAVDRWDADRILARFRQEALSLAQDINRSTAAPKSLER